MIYESIIEFLQFNILFVRKRHIYVTRCIVGNDYWASKITQEEEGKLHNNRNVIACLGIGLLLHMLFLLLVKISSHTGIQWDTIISELVDGANNTYADTHISTCITD